MVLIDIARLCVSLPILSFGVPAHRFKNAAQRGRAITKTKQMVRTASIIIFRQVVADVSFFALFYHAGQMRHRGHLGQR